MIAGIADLLDKSHSYHLFDSFEGLPPAKEVDGASAIEWHKNIHSPGYHDNCTAEVEWAERAMDMSRAASVEIHKGWFEDTFGGQPFAEPISLAI